MPYGPHAKVVFGGNLNNLGTAGVDVWQCNVNISPLSLTDAFCDAYLAAIQAGLKTWFTGGTNLMSNVADLRFVKCNLIGTDGKYTNPTVTHRFDYTSIGVGPTVPNMPATNTLAFGWSTALMRGPGSKGRIYPPFAAASALAGGSVATSGNIASAVTSAKALLTVLASSSTTAAVPIVASGVNAALTPITGVRIGNLIDSQRRRRNAINETYSSSTWP